MLSPAKLSEFFLRRLFPPSAAETCGREVFGAAKRRSAVSAATPPPPPSESDGLPTVEHLEQALGLYRQVMRTNRKALQKPSAVQLANAFVSAEFRAHMAAAAEAASGGAASSPRQVFSSEAKAVRPLSLREFEMFLSAWREYVCLASDEHKPLRQGRALRPSQRKMLSQDQKQQLERLRDAVRSKASDC